jgi:hypothetical protein
MRGRSFALTKSGIVALALIVGTTFQARGGDSAALIGNWRLVSWQVIVGDETQNPFGLNPRGYLILTREGRSMALTTADNRKPGDGTTERAALQKSMLAYTGKYRIEGDDFITTVEISWNEIWNGTEQRRHYRIEGDRLFIETIPAPSITNSGKTDFRRLIWEREN